MLDRVIKIISILSFLMSISMAAFVYVAILYMQSPEFERDLKNKLMGDLQEKMMKEIPLQMPTETFPAMPL